MNEVLRDTKTAMRAAFLARRRSLSPQCAAEWSVAAVARLRALPEALDAPAWLVYLASKDNELDTLPLVEELLRARKVVMVPIADKAGSLLWSRLHDLSEAAPASFGILEPRPEYRRIVEPPEDALAIVPGIVFTRDGARIGYGGGYYDRFLCGFPGVKIGLAYEMQLAETIPTAPHDIPLDLVVTESAAYRARKA